MLYADRRQNIANFFVEHHLENLRRRRKKNQWENYLGFEHGFLLTTKWKMKEENKRKRKKGDQLIDFFNFLIYFSRRWMRIDTWTYILFYWIIDTWTHPQASKEESIKERFPFIQFPRTHFFLNEIDCISRFHNRHQITTVPICLTRPDVMFLSPGNHAIKVLKIGK